MRRRVHARRRRRARRPLRRGRAFAAAPTDAYWRRISSIAFADQGSSSQSSTSQPVPSSSQMPADSTAPRTRLSSGLRVDWIVEERPAGARVDRAGLAAVDAEALARDVGVAAHDHDRARSHVLLLADHVRDAGAPVLRERLLGMLQEIRPARGRRRRHRRRQVDEPARIDREPAHDLQRGRGVLLADRDRPREPRPDDALAGDVVDVQHDRRPVLVRERRRVLGRQERLGRLVVRARSRQPRPARVPASAAR